LDTKLKIINIWAVPLIISIIAIIMAVVRRRQRRQPAMV
jgi:cytochrome c-type biogenesis protein CcmH/NrfF